MCLWQCFVAVATLFLTKVYFVSLEMETQSCQAILSGQVSLSFERKVMGRECEMPRKPNLHFSFWIDFAKTLQWTHRRQAGLAFRVILSFNKVIMYFKPDQFRIKRPNERATEAVCTRAGKPAPVYEQFPNPAFLSYILLFFSCIL